MEAKRGGKGSFVNCTSPVRFRVAASFEHCVRSGIGRLSCNRQCCNVEIVAATRT